MTAKQTGYNRKWSEKQTANGMCIFCKNPKLKHSKLCEKCYFKLTAQNTLKDRRLANDIQNLFYLQGGRCFITGDELVLGLNAGLDHLEPKSKSPHLISEITNVRWVDRAINTAKGNLTIDEFIDMCTLVAKRHHGGTDLFIPGNRCVGNCDD